MSYSEYITIYPRDTNEIKNKNWRKNNPKKVIEYTKNWRKNNPEKADREARKNNDTRNK